MGVTQIHLNNNEWEPRRHEGSIFMFINKKDRTHLWVAIKAHGKKGWMEVKNGEIISSGKTGIQICYNDVLAKVS